jgi:hypothetical protein
MEFTDINSTMIDKVAFDNNRGMFVQFKTTGQLYNFPDVPKELYEQFLAAPSQGKFFSAQIKNKFSFTKTEE